MLRKIGKWFTEHLAHGHEVTLVEPIRPGDLEDENPQAQAFTISRHTNGSTDDPCSENEIKKHRRLSDRLAIKKKTKVKKFKPNDEDCRHQSKRRVHSVLHSEVTMTKRRVENALEGGRNYCKEKIPEGSRQPHSSVELSALPPLREVIRDRERERGGTLVGVSGLGTLEKATRVCGQSTICSSQPEAGMKGQSVREPHAVERSRNKEKTKGKRRQPRDLSGAAPRIKTPDRTHGRRSSKTFVPRAPETSAQIETAQSSDEYLQSSTKPENPKLLQETSRGEEEFGNKQDSSTTETDDAKERGVRGGLNSYSPVSSPTNSGLNDEYLNSPRGNTCQATPSSKFPWPSPAFAVSKTARLPFGAKIAAASRGKGGSRREKSVTVLYSDEELELMGAIVQQFPG